ncbi:hypothetical protein FB381_3027 [Nocardioides albertanoniae]|uniref:Uncharacterized protein n=1 Tax=Nocardioides albertanoniae TaxID=1175486 RepID=A0A543A989_9ACTN|nr:hypothetical protein [Nocardioides albertanoniae]TQL69125.1 hypothetical protein FB381_3027 [Nocardioides albertanoniae]
MVTNGTQGNNDPSGTPGDDSETAPITAPTPERVKEEGEHHEAGSEFDSQDETEIETFPASDPQSSWAGPADPRDRPSPS